MVDKYRIDIMLMCIGKYKTVAYIITISEIHLCENNIHHL